MSRLLALIEERTSRYERTVMGPRRARLLARARGHVLELGAGTGTNLPHYTPGRRVVLTEPDPHRRRRLRRRSELRPLRAEVLGVPAEGLPLPDASVDTVVTTLVLCSVDDPGVVLAEARRVLRPDGRLLVLEHVRAEDPAIARWQDRLTPVTRRLGGGCRPNRDTVAALAAAGFDITGLSPVPAHHPAERLQPLVQGAVEPSACERSEDRVPATASDARVVRP